MSNISRAELVKFINKQLDEMTDEMFYTKKCSKHHYGRAELKELLDFLYGGPPTDESEYLNQSKTKL